MRQNDDEFREQSCEAVRFRGISSKQIWFLNLIALHVLNLETSATWLAWDRLANQALELYGDCVELRWLIAANTTRCPARAKKNKPYLRCLLFFRVPTWDLVLKAAQVCSLY